MAISRKTGTVDKSTQEWLPKMTVRNGMVILDDEIGARKYVKVIDVRPIPFYTLPEEEKERIYTAFNEWVRTAPKNWGMCATTMETDIEGLVRYIENQSEKENSEKVKEEIDKYTDWMRSISRKQTVDRKTYIFFEYEATEDEQAESEEEIAYYLSDRVEQYSVVFSGMGIGINEHKDDYDEFLMEMLYRYMNRKTSKNVPFADRQAFMENDACILQNSYSPNVDIRNYLAPSYVDDRHEQYVVIDGIYYTMLYMQPLTMPLSAAIGWLDGITAFGTSVSFSIQFEKMSHDFTLNRLEQSERITKAMIRDSRSGGIQEDRRRRANNIQYVTDRMRSDEDLWKTVLVVALSANTLKDLMSLKRNFIQAMRRGHIRMIECYNRMSDAFFMTMPISYRNRPICSYAENDFLTSAVATTFLFTDYNINDPHGAVLAIDEAGKLVRFDPFNTDARTNANGIVVGISGSGKTFAMNVLLRHMRLMGMKMRLILPIKGDIDYHRSTDSVDGEFVSLMPGSQSCVNIFEIRLQDDADESLIAGGAFTHKSLLAAKIEEIRAWLVLRSRQTMKMDEKNMVDQVLYDMYEDYGITEDNASVKRFVESGKPFPTFSDFDRYLAEVEELKVVRNSIQMFVHGRCKNLNGQTNVDLNNKWIAFDVDKNVCGDMLAEYYFIAMSICNADAHRSRTEYVLLFYDEVQEVTRVPETAASIDEQYATMRGYGSGVWCATQQVGKLTQMDMGGEVSHTIVSNAATKIIMQTDPSEAKEVNRMFDLSPDELKYVTQSHKGSGLFIAGGAHSRMKFIATQDEFWTFNTDPKMEKKRQEYLGLTRLEQS
ncbi:type IV secretion system DNA-binding domain-containing protein [Bilifractor sp. LCP19S3_H10]|uniref:VirB4 family type IV secretion system protein n=1 Tax=Bilifractor sp. LCP19S3_H10 TaxID=3438736 RepID=UPI003F91863E